MKDTKKTENQAPTLLTADDVIAMLGYVAKSPEGQVAQKKNPVRFGQRLLELIEEIGQIRSADMKADVASNAYSKLTSKIQALAEGLR